MSNKKEGDRIENHFFLSRVVGFSLVLVALLKLYLTIYFFLSVSRAASRLSNSRHLFLKDNTTGFTWGRKKKQKNIRWNWTKDLMDCIQQAQSYLELTTVRLEWPINSLVPYGFFLTGISLFFQPRNHVLAVAKELIC